MGNTSGIKVLPHIFFQPVKPDLYGTFPLRSCFLFCRLNRQVLCLFHFSLLSDSSSPALLFSHSQPTCRHSSFPVLVILLYQYVPYSEFEKPPCSRPSVHALCPASPLCSYSSVFPGCRAIHQTFHIGYEWRCDIERKWSIRFIWRCYCYLFAYFRPSWF